MSTTSRRSFLAVAGSGAVGTAVMATAPGTWAAPPSPRTDARALVDQPLVAHVRDAAAGTVVLYVGHDEVIVHDPDLVQRLARAAGR